MGAADVQELQEKLDRVERALERSERIAVASRFAGAIMHEVTNPLVYLAREQRNEPELVLEYMTTIRRAAAGSWASHKPGTFLPP